MTMYSHRNALFRLYYSSAKSLFWFLLFEIEVKVVLGTALREEGVKSLPRQTCANTTDLNFSFLTQVCQ